MRKEAETRTAFSRSMVLFMAIVGAINLLAMVGWVNNLPILASLRAEFIPMAPITVLIFLGLCVVWLIYRVFSARYWMKILVQVSLVGLLIIVIILALRYFTKFGPDLENWLYPNPPLLGGIETARISPLTILGFFLTILAFLLMIGRESGQFPISASGALSLIVLILSGINILGYLYRAPLFYGGTLIPVGITTALSFMFLSLVLLMTAGPSRWPIRVFVGTSLKARLMRAFVPVSWGIVLLQGFFSTASAQWITNLGLRVALAALVACLIVIHVINLISQNLSTEIERGNQARLNAEIALKQSEARFRAFAESANDAIINVDRDGQIVFWNRAAELIFGYSIREVIDKSLGMIMPEEFRAAHQQGFQRVMLTGESHILGKTVELTGLRKDGREFPLALSLATWQASNEVFFTGIVRDISEPKQAEIALIDERNLLATLLNNVPDMIYFKDAQSRFIRTNQAMARRVGLDDPVEIIGKTDFDLFGEEHSQEAYADEQTIIRSGQPVVAKEEKETFLDGHTLWVSSTKMPLRNQHGHIVGTFGVSRDITDRKLAEEALRESEERFRSLYENIPTGIYRTSPSGHILMANPVLVRMLGYESFEELSQRNLASEDYQLENPREELQKRIELDKEVRGLESLWRRKDGSLINVRQSAHLVLDENNQPLYSEGTVEDISERISAEKALQKSASSLQAVLQSTADGILAVGLVNDVLYFNGRFTELWQIPDAVMISMNGSILLQHILEQLNDPQSFLKKIQDLYRTKEESFDILNFKDGRVFERLSRPLKDGEAIRGRVWSFRDITERIRMEEEIRSLSLTDELTGLYNRRGFTLLAEQELKLAHRENRSLFLVYCDMDNLKPINDTLGHISGDQALKEISATLKECFRESDILGRMGGDEFVALALDASEGNTGIIADRIKSALEARNQKDGATYHLDLSLGILFFDPSVPCTLNELLIQADKLMYEQKQGRKRKL